MQSRIIAAGRGFDAQMGQLAFAALQPAFYLAQGMGAAQLTEQHADKLAPARQALAAIFATRLFDDAFTLGLLRSGAGGFGDSPTPYTFG